MSLSTLAFTSSTCRFQVFDKRGLTFPLPQCQRYKSLSPPGYTQGMQVGISGQDVFVYDGIYLAIYTLTPPHLIGKIEAGRSGHP